MPCCRLSKIQKILIATGVILIILQCILISFYVNEKDAVIIKVSQDSDTFNSQRFPTGRPAKFEATSKLINSEISVSVASKELTEDVRAKSEHSKRILPHSIIHISAVVCGERTQEATTMLKSNTLFTNRTIQIHVVAEDHLHATLKDIFSDWSNVKSGQVLFKLYSLLFPAGENAEEWKRLFKPCATQRLFLLDVLKDVDSILYMDTDVLMLRPVEDIWNHFDKFDSQQLASMTPEGEEASLSWYPRFARHPFYGPNGMNSGVMLMNLTRMREFGWTERVLEIHRKYKLKITWGDQDILNILFHDHPELLFEYSCDWNYRPDHCMYGNNCGAAKNQGISVIHGNREVYHNEKQPFFKAIYAALREFQPGNDLKLLANHLAENLQATASSYCGAMIDKVLKYPNQMSRRLQ